MIKTGKDHLEQLRDGRVIFIGDEKVSDVTKHPSLKRAAKTVAQLYDLKHTKEPFVHDHWEEVFLVSGDLIVGNDEQGNGGKTFNKATYACRPPGVYHGPFKSENGCTLFELHYYKNDEEF